VAAYPTAAFIGGEATSVARETDGFAVNLALGDVLHSARLVLAFGIADELPALPGLAERWGTSVLHCPYCHGFEFSGQRLGVLNMSPMAIHQSMLISEWGPTTFYLNGSPPPDEAALAELRECGITIEQAPVQARHGHGPRLSAIELCDGRTCGLDALYLGPPTRLNSEIAQHLGCAMDDGPFGKIIRTDGAQLTTVSDVYAAGDITRAAHNVTWASADGVTAGMAMHRSLVF